MSSHVRQHTEFLGTCWRRGAALLLAYYVEWHLREAWRELMFADEVQVTMATRDPVAPAKRSQAADAEARRRTIDDDIAVHSISTLLSELSTIVRNISRAPGAGCLNR